MKTCQTCRWWRPIPAWKEIIRQRDTGNQAICRVINPEAQIRGECCVNPPVPGPWVDYGNIKQLDYHEAMRPATEATDFCSKFENNPAKAE